MHLIRNVNCTIFVLRTKIIQNLHLMHFAYKKFNIDFALKNTAECKNCQIIDNNYMIINYNKH